MLSSFLNSCDKETPKLKVGIMLASGMAPRFLAEILTEIRRSDFACLDLVVNLDQCSIVVPRRVLFACYDRWDRRRTDTALDPFARVDVVAELSGVKWIGSTITRDGILPSHVLDAIFARDLDVILLAPGIRLSGTVLNAARHGVWVYQFGDGQRYSGEPPYFWEVRDEYPLCGVELRRVGGDGAPREVLCTAFFASRVGENTSWRQNRIGPGWGAAYFVLQQLHRLHQTGNLVSAPATPPASSPRAGVPGDLDMAKWLCSSLTRKASRALRSKRVEHWKMAIRVGPQQLLQENGTADTGGFRWVESAPGHLYADPFLIRRDGRLWLFYEHYVYAHKRAVIDCVEVKPDGTLGVPLQALKRDYHLSFPHVFEHNGEVYMIPETGGNRTVELYRAVDFPSEWKLEKVLLTGHNAVDTAVLWDSERWWFFVTLKETRGGASILALFHSSDLMADWQYHPANPIVTDVRTVRGAGAIFLKGGRLLRPSQDCSARYGYRLNLHEIKRLNPLEYGEEKVLTLDPQMIRGLVGIHTYNQCLGAEVIDGCVLTDSAEHVRSDVTSGEGRELILQCPEPVS